MAAEIEAAGGTIEKFVGDAVMAAFGAPGALEDHAERALHAALAMQRKVESGLTLRIGVNTGEVVVGQARAGSSFVSGDAVNVAVRLEQAAEPGEVVAGERTVAAARGAFEFGEPMTVEAKGKAGGIPCRRVVRGLSLMRTRGVGGLARAFVGRDEELERLRSSYRRAVEDSRPVLVTIVGDAGVGKTRLVRELWERLADEQPEPLRRTGRCLAYGEGITYWPLAEVLKEHLWILESDSPEEVRRRLGEREILGLTLGLDVAGNLHPLAARDRLHAAWVAFVSELTEGRPVVVLVEDVHWAEQPLLDLIERLAREVRGSLLLLVTARPDFVDGRAAWDGRMDTETVWLEPLGIETARSLVDSLLAGDLRERVRELIVDRAEGNPFFVEEVLGSLIDAGVLERANGTWRVGDLLPEAEKTALQAAAVIGRIFWTSPVYELVAGHEPDLRVLESRDFIRRRSDSSLEGEVEYVFKHALTREVAYGSLTKARRARLHAQFAEWIERIGEGRDEHAPLLAHHYAEAVRPEDVDVAWPDAGPELERLRAKAISWLSRAADAAISRYEIDDALGLLHRARALESDRAETARLWQRVGREYAEAYADLAFEAASRSGMGKRRPGRDVMDEWTSRALANVEHGSAAHVKALLSRVYWGLPGAEETALLAAKLADELGDPALRSCGWDARATEAFRRGDFATAHMWETRRFDHIDELTNPDLIHDLYLSTIPTCAATGRMREARRLATTLDELVTRLTPHHRLHGVACRLEVEELVGDWDSILELESRAEEAVDENRDTPCIRNSRSLLLCALANELAGRSDRSRELEARAAEMEGEGYGATLATPRVRIALVRGELEQLDEVLADEDWLQRQTWFSLPAAAARLDALAVVGNPAAVEEAAMRVGRPKTYLEPFAVRALGVVREDEKLLARADERFRALRLDWYASQTESLIRFRKLAAG